MSRERRLLVEQVAAMVPPPPEGQCVRVGVDGVDGVGKTVLAAELSAALRDLGRDVVSLDGFHHPRAVRYRRGQDSPEGSWLDSYDYQAFSEHVLEPFARGGSRRYRSVVHDVVTDEPVESDRLTAPAGAVLVVDGLFLGPALVLFRVLAVASCEPRHRQHRRSAPQDHQRRGRLIPVGRRSAGSDPSRGP